jgi:hypothetical protein
MKERGFVFEVGVLDVACDAVFFVGRGRDGFEFASRKLCRADGVEESRGPESVARRGAGGGLHQAERALKLSDAAVPVAGLESELGSLCLEVGEERGDERADLLGLAEENGLFDGGGFFWEGEQGLILWFF